MTIDQLYIEQCQKGCKELATKLSEPLKEMSREDLEREAALLAYRFKSLHDNIMKTGRLPNEWEQSYINFFGING